MNPTLFVDAACTDLDINTLTDNDWQLAPSNDVNILQGGLDGFALGWGFTIDFAGTTRTNLIDGQDDSPTNSGADGWSIGAYESDAGP